MFGKVVRANARKQIQAIKHTAQTSLYGSPHAGWGSRATKHTLRAQEGHIKLEISHRKALSTTTKNT